MSLKRRNSTHYTRQNRQKKGVKHIILWALFGFILLSASVLGYYAYTLSNFFDHISVADDQEVDEELTTHLEDIKPFSILLLGEDLDQDSSSRTDTIIVATVNPSQESIQLVSIPRDTLVQLEDGTVEKINAMYTMGGIKQITKEVEKLLDIPISFYSILDFEGLVDLVDAVGGITVNSKLAFTVQNSSEKSDAITIKKGKQTLNGEEALGYARMRMQDPKGVFGRQERQEEVIKQLMSELVSPKVFTRLDKILNAISPHLKTNISSNQLLKIATHYTRSAQSVKSLTITGEDAMTYFPHYGLNVYVFLPDADVLERISNQLKTHLELEEDYTHPLNKGRLPVDYETVPTQPVEEGTLYTDPTYDVNTYYEPTPEVYYTEQHSEIQSPYAPTAPPVEQTEPEEDSTSSLTND